MTRPTPKSVDLGDREAVRRRLGVLYAAFGMLVWVRIFFQPEPPKPWAMA